MEILTARQKKAEELKRLTDLASQMAEMQLAELRAEIKVSCKISQPELWARDADYVGVAPIECYSKDLTSYTQLSFTRLDREQKGEEPSNHYI